MSVEVFVDTSILFYAHTDSVDARHTRARDSLRVLWQRPGEAAVSVQVLQELHVNLVRKAKLDVARSAQLASLYFAWRVIDNDRALLKTAFDTQARWGLSFWDSLIVSAAQRSGARLLWSEDLSEGQHFGKVTVTNPLQQP